jgi:hypothetical protein
MGFGNVLFFLTHGIDNNIVSFVSMLGIRVLSGGLAFICQLLCLLVISSCSLGLPFCSLIFFRLSVRRRLIYQDLFG